MKLELLEKFLLELIPPQARNPVHSVFNGMRQMPVPTVLQGLGQLSEQITREGSDESVAAVNGLVLGIALSYGVSRSSELEQIMEQYLVNASKAKGENVVDFLSKRVERGK